MQSETMASRVWQDDWDGSEPTWRGKFATDEEELHNKTSMCKTNIINTDNNHNIT